MLRLPRFGVARPSSLDEALGLLADNPHAMPMAGGTDLVPNLKHRLHSPELLVALDRLSELCGIRRDADGSLAIGAMTSIHDLAISAEAPPALAQAAASIASPQIRRSATLGGNVLLDTRCRYYNQTLFWRRSLGYCIKKDGSLCHVVEGGRKCVAAAVSDTVPALMTLGATLSLAGKNGRRELPIDAFHRGDGAANKQIEPGELLIELRIPRPVDGHRGAYDKLRDREAIDFALLGVAVRVDLDPGGAVVDADLVCTALGAKPQRVPGMAELLRGKRPGQTDFTDAVREASERAHKKCHPLANLPGDSEWRREMVPVIVRRALIRAVGA
jgi:4-hydroxybenzoyl-CoA reductase subunit beta